MYELYDVEIIDGSGFVVETDDCGMCSACKEWSGAVYILNNDFEVEEVSSSCCAAHLLHHHPSSSVEQLVIESAQAAVV